MAAADRAVGAEPPRDRAVRGFGWTDAPAGGYDPEVFANDIVALLVALEIEGHVDLERARAFLT